MEGLYMIKRTLAALVTSAALALGVGSCTRSGALEHARPALRFSKAGMVDLPEEAGYAKKRGFADFTCDGITDMIELRDEAIIGQKWTGKIFAGYKGDDGLLHFAKPRKFNLPINSKWFSSKTKLDTADVNGDKCADVVVTQYFEGILTDTYKMGIAMNLGDGTKYKLLENVSREGVPFGVAILRLAESMDENYENINDYLQLDWSDVNGDGKDDANIFWKSGFLGSDLYVEAWYSSTPTNNTDKVDFSGWSSQKLPDFLKGVSIRDVDTEDFTGNGKADVVIFDAYRGSDKIRIGFAENRSAGNRVHYTVHKDFVGREIDMDTIGFEKRDSFDVNFDGKADYIHAGTKGSARKMSYLLTK